jgi:hypothetical protein
MGPGLQAEPLGPRFLFFEPTLSLATTLCGGPPATRGLTGPRHQVEAPGNRDVEMWSDRGAR